MWPETIGNLVSEVGQIWSPEPGAHSQKPIIGGHFRRCRGKISMRRTGWLGWEGFKPRDGELSANKGNCDPNLEIGGSRHSPIRKIFPNSIALKS
jgi:hypothetical protein